MELARREILTVMGALMTAMLLSALDQTVMGTALPTIVGDFGGLEHLSWVVTSYLLTSTAAVPLFGKLSDIFGAKKLFQVAIVLFVFGSVLAGASQDMLQLILARGVQGIGGGGIMAMTFTIMGMIISPRERGKYSSYFTSVFAVSSIVGPLAGGFLVDSLSWRWIFYINVPLGAIAMVVINRYLHVPLDTERRRVDIPGAVLLVSAVTCLLLVSVWGGQEYAWRSTTILTLAVVGAALGVSFFWHERRTEEPLVPLHLFRDPVMRVATVVGALIGAAMFGGTTFMPVFLQVAGGVSPTQSGLLLLPLMLGFMAGSVTSGRLVSRTGRYKLFPICGTALGAVGMFVLSMLDADSSRFHSSVGMGMLGIGLGATMPTLVMAVQNTAPARDLGAATSLVNFTRSLGGALGVALLGAVLSSRLALRLGGAMDRGLLNSPDRIAQLPDAVRLDVAAAVADAVSHVFLVATPLLVLAFAVAVFLREVPLRESVHASGASGMMEGAEGLEPDRATAS